MAEAQTRCVLPLNFFIVCKERETSENRWRKRKLPTIIWDTLHFVSTTSPNFCFTEEISKLAVIASNINKAKEYTFKGQARFLTLEVKLY